MKDVLSFVLMVYGEVYVTVDGMLLMLILSVLNWAMLN